jgi:hypothetical protein
MHCGAGGRVEGATILFELESIKRGEGPSGYARWLQAALNRVARAGLTVDGVLGARTRSAVARFQRQQGLVADGVAGAATTAALVRAGAERPPSRGGGAPATPPAPGACQVDPRVAELTIFEPIALGAPGVPNQTAIYVPPGLRRSAEVDLLVYLHGWETNRKGQVICGRARTISEYLSDRSFALREALRDSGKNAVLVVPKLGAHSEPGTLSRGGFARFIDSVMRALSRCGAWTSPPSPRRLVLSGHSGGGATVAAIAAVNGELVAFLKEVWMFDALYGDVSAWAKFFAGRPDVVGRFAFTKEGNTGTNHKALAAQVGSARVEIRPSRTTSHCQVPRTEIGTYLAQSAFDNR